MAGSRLKREKAETVVKPEVVSGPLSGAGVRAWADSVCPGSRAQAVSALARELDANGWYVVEVFEVGVVIREA